MDGYKHFLTIQPHVFNYSEDQVAEQEGAFAVRKTWVQTLALHTHQAL